MKLTAHTFVSLDGVMQGPGGPAEDTSGGFALGGWTAPYMSEDFGAIVAPWFERTGAVLLGRTTYDIFASYWPLVTDPTDVVAARLNSVTKHVVSTTLTDPTWGETEVIGGSLDEVVAAVQAVKDRPGAGDGELQVHGSCGLLHTLHDAGLVDEYHLVVFPVVLGSGKKLFPEGALPQGFEVIDSRVTPAGLVSLVLRPVGAPRVGNHEVVDGHDTAIV